VFTRLNYFYQKYRNNMQFRDFIIMLEFSQNF